MSKFFVQFTDYAEGGMRGLAEGRKQEIKSAAKSALGSDPYGGGSAAVRGDRDRREITLVNAILSYDVSPAVVVVSVVRVSAPFG
ncbi:hypothetical protein [Embleya hyalina]|uniref:Uncharacterized protein n=1 Tax=Embleya hyalina TaxID=516124 RepID=A0A401Z295_9ACTN|nr:hypothetical protein [Embleya hyalina]GCE00911.1 hypothetical protein EHYA_08638 [Embleya hyalina]